MTIYNWENTYHPSTCFSNRTIKYIYNRIIKNRVWDHNINCDSNIVMDVIYNTQFNNNWIGYDYIKFIQDLFRYPHTTLSEFERFQKMRALGAARTLEYFCIKYDSTIGTEKFNERTTKRNIAVRKDAIKKIGKNKVHKIKTGLTNTSAPIMITLLTDNQIKTIIKNTKRFRHNITQDWVDIFKLFDKLTFNLLAILSDIGNITSIDHVYNQYLNYKADTSNATLEKFKNRWGDQAEKMYYRTWGKFHSKNITINSVVGKIVRETTHKPISFDIVEVISKYININESQESINNKSNIIKNVIRYKCSKRSIKERIQKLIGNRTHFTKTELIYGDDAINHMEKYFIRRQKQSNKSNCNLSESALVDKHLLINNDLCCKSLTKIISTDYYKLSIKNGRFADTTKLLTDLNNNNTDLFDAYINWNKSKYYDRLVIRFGQEKAKSIILDKTKKQKNQIDRNIFYGTKASKESLDIFVPIFNKIKSKHPTCWVYFGYDNFREYRLPDIDKNSHFFYDFTLPQYNIIFEYNGSIWHPRPNKMLTEEWNNWRNPFDLKMTALDKYNQDQRKITIAKNHNFDIIELWDTDTIEYNISIMIETLKQKGLII